MVPERVSGEVALFWTTSVTLFVIGDATRTGPVPDPTFDTVPTLSIAPVVSCNWPAAAVTVPV